MSKYRVEFAKWVNGSGYSYNATIDNIDELIGAAVYVDFMDDEELAQAGDGRYDIIDNATNKVIDSYFYDTESR